MEEKSYPIRSYQNLRVYQYATTLATDLLLDHPPFP